MSWSRERMDRITYDVRSIANWAKNQCAVNSIVSDITEATLADTQSVSSAAYTEDQNIRSIEVQSDTADGKLEVTLSLADGTTAVFRTFTGGAWNYELPVNSSPVIGVTVQNVTGTALSTDVIINVASKS